MPKVPIRRRRVGDDRLAVRQKGREFEMSLVSKQPLAPADSLSARPPV